MASAQSFYTDTTAANVKNMYYMSDKKAVAKEDCKGASKDNSLICSNLAFQEAYTRMDSTFNALVSVLKKGSRHDEAQFIIQAQQKWVDMRDTYCEICLKMYKKGEYAPIAYMDCLRMLSINRREELDVILQEVK